MAAEARPHGEIRISPVDRLGRPISPLVLSAAEDIALRAIHHAEKLLIDSAVATSLLEEAAATVSRAISVKAQTAATPVRNLHAYLFRAFIRRINKARKRQVVLTDAVATKLKSSRDGIDVAKEFDLKILLDEFLTRCDAITRDMFYRRVQGFSWKEIGECYGISGHAAESKFGQTIQRLKKRFGNR